LVKPPQYEAMDYARQEEIPEAFKKYSTKEYKLKKIEPRKDAEPMPGPIPRPYFEVFDKRGKLNAQFYPNGHSKCLEEKFKPIYEKIVESIEEAAQKRLQEYIKFETEKPSPEKYEPHFPE
jgi:hypothetical protein